MLGSKAEVGSEFLPRPRLCDRFNHGLNARVIHCTTCIRSGVKGIALQR